MATDSSPQDPSRRLLLAEDDDELAEATELALADAGWTVVRARDGRQALDLLPVVHPRVLLLDLVMPTLDGFGVLQRLRAARRPSPLVIATSDFPDFLPEAVKLGADGVLAKPYDLEGLLRVIEAALRGDPPPRAARRPGASVLPGPGGAPPEELEELARIERLHCLRIVREEPDAVLDELVKVTAELIRTPIALISIITRDRQWWKAMHGIEGQLARERGTPRDLSFCTHAVAAKAPLVVANARLHPVFRDNLLVRDGTLSSYAGVPVQIPGVGALGTLCVLDTRPREFSAADLELLGLLAERVAAEIEWRYAIREEDRPPGTMRYLALMDDRHGIYNERAFASLTSVCARRALLSDQPFSVVAFDWPIQAIWPESEPDEDLDRALRAIESVRSIVDVVGRFGDRGLAVLLPRSTEEAAREFAELVLETERALDGGHQSRLAAAWASCPGGLTADCVLRQLEHRLRERVGGTPAAQQAFSRLGPHDHHPSG